MRKITIITEGGELFGFGHITRCLSIANRFLNYDFSVKFLIDGDDTLLSILKDIKYEIFNWSTQEQQLFEELKSSTIILIDSIEIKDELILKIQSLGALIIYIDDERRRNILDSGVVIDWTVLSEKKDYFFPQKEGVKYLLGSKYASLRKDFNNVEKNQIKEKIECIMVTFGGADVRNLTPKILELLTEKFPNIEKNIVVGAGFKNIAEIEKFKDLKTNLIFNADTSQMIGLMQNNDIAIASGGQTLYELALVGTPTIAILLVENAKDDTLGWGEVGSVKNIGWYNDMSLLDRLKETIYFLEDKRVRVEMQNRAKEHISLDGATLLVDEIIGELNDIV